MFIQYNDWNPRRETVDIINSANDIIQEYSLSGLVLTLRQLYYQFVARDLLPNTERSYKNLSTIVTKARNAGLMSWTGIEDRNRGHNTFWSAEDPFKEVMALPDYIRFDQWARQDIYVEVWVEKEALGNVIQKACSPYLVPYMSCKGYLSASEAWRAGRRIKQKEQEGKECVIIHLGDHDPSGIDMTRDNRERLHLYGETFDCEVKRIALNMDQVHQYRCPNNPAKLTDSRCGDYIRKFGKHSWELDALEPKVLINLIQNEIKDLIDFRTWDEVQEEEVEVKNQLRKLAENYYQIQDFLGN